MPYIPNENDRRINLDEVVQLMIDLNVKVDGDLNYILYSFCKRAIKSSYNNLKNYCGELRQCATEIERRILAKHEDEAIERNGDID